MSKGRVFSRPRTKVYDTNYNIGESYYRPALDRLDRKYGGGLGEFPRGGVANGDALGMRSPPPPPMDLPSPRTALRDVEDDFFGEPHRRRPHSAFLGELDSLFEGRMRSNAPSRASRVLDDEIEEELTSSMKRLRARGSKSSEFEDVEGGLGRREPGRLRGRLEFGEKLMDSVGLTGKVRQALEEEGGTTAGRRRMLRMTSDGGEGEELTRWTALKPGGASRKGFLDEEQQELHAGAEARARKTRARLEDLESEMQAISEKGAAREKRVRDLKALVQENEASALDNLQTTVRVKSSIQSEKKMVSF